MTNIFQSFKISGEFRLKFFNFADNIFAEQPDIQSQISKTSIHEGPLSEKMIGKGKGKGQLLWLCIYINDLNGYLNILGPDC